ncbi:MAG: helix-turn-helix domain-containing protein [Lewinella sp.]
MKSEFTYLRLDGEEIAVWIEKKTNQEESAYYHQSLLFFMKKGTLHFRTADKINSYSAPAYIFVPKNTLGYFRKTWTPKEENAELYILLLRDDLIRAGIKEIPLPGVPVHPHSISILQLNESEELVTLFKNIPHFFVGDKKVNSENVLDGMIQIIQSCIATDPALHAYFTDVSSPIRIHLKSVVDHHFNLSYTVEELANLMGLSLSTFYREFRKEFGQPPHQWLMQRRLKEAFELLTNSDKSVSAVCYETGFKDLGHFSRRFKKQFGVSPSMIKK